MGVHAKLPDNALILCVPSVFGQVGRTSKDCDSDLQVPSLHDLREAMPGLWSVPPSTEHKESVHMAGEDQEASRTPPVVRRQGVCGRPAESSAECRRREVKVAG